MKKKVFQRGFTFAEAIVVMGIMMTLFGLAYVSLFKTQQKITLDSVVALIVSEIKAQQVKAMNGETEGAIDTINFGIHFETDKYVLFKGLVYNSADSSNFAVDLKEPLEFSEIKFPDANLIFNRGGGEVWNFIDGFNSVTLRSADLSQKSISINKYGAVSIF
jgi:type II secretory pathway pseudopilin PulG